MNLVDYLLIFVSALGIAGFGRHFVGGMGFRALLVGMIVLGTIASILSRFAPNLIEFVNGGAISVQKAEQNQST